MAAAAPIGHAAYRAFGIEPSATYVGACATLRAGLVPCDPYVRPAGKVKGAMRDMAFRGPFVVQCADGTKRGRLVREHRCKRTHIEQAFDAQPPSRTERSGYACRPDTCAAVRHCVAKGNSLRKWRRKQQTMLGDVRRRLEGENGALRAAVASPSNVRAIARDVNVALLCALCDALDWPDSQLPVNFVRGFQAVGDVPDSGVHRAVEPELDAAAFEVLRASIDATNADWLSEVCSLLERRARTASAEQLGHMRELKAKSDKEVASGLCGVPLTRAQLVRRYTRGGRLRTRVLPRFGVVQGKAGKLRVIDDAKQSRTNDMQRLRETIVTPSPEFPAHVLEELARACVAAGVPIPDVDLGLDDLFAAYRRVPTSQPEYMVAAIWDVDAGAPVFYETFGHAFGLCSSVTNFNRVPHLLCVAAALIFAAPVDHFFDDYLTVDFVSAKGSAQESLDVLHEAVRIGLEPTKRKRAAQEQVELGVACDLRSAASRRVVYLSPTPERVADILGDLQACETRGVMTPAEAEAVFGRVSFALSTVAGAVGRAASQPLLQRAHEGPAGGSLLPFTASMRSMLRYYEALLPALPPLALRFGEQQEAPVVVYTDASYNERGWSGLGIVILDGDDCYEAGMRVPAWLLEWLRPRGQQINHLEAIAQAAARVTFPDVFKGRRALCFVDNTVALSKAVHGYANEPDMAAVVNALHACDAALACDAWFEWVPSKANVADLPSRDASTWDAEDAALMTELRARPGYDWREMQLPTAAELDDPTAMLRRAFELAG